MVGDTLVGSLVFPAKYFSLGFGAVFFILFVCLLQPKRDEDGAKGQEVASPAVVSQSRSQTKKRKRLLKENGGCRS
jgi:hypothetical protein